jgi:hypothetical protein
MVHSGRARPLGGGNGGEQEGINKNISRQVRKEREEKIRSEETEECINGGITFLSSGFFSFPAQFGISSRFINSIRQTNHLYRILLI